MYLAEKVTEEERKTYEDSGSVRLDLLFPGGDPMQNLLKAHRLGVTYFEGACPDFYILTKDALTLARKLNEQRNNELAHKLNLPGHSGSLN